CPRVVPIVIRHPAHLLGRLYLCEQIGMVAFFDTQNVMHVVCMQHLDMRGIGTQAVFSDNHLTAGEQRQLQYPDWASTGVYDNQTPTLSLAAIRAWYG